MFILYLYFIFSLYILSGYIVETILSAVCVSVQQIENYLSDQPCTSVRPLRSFSSLITKWKYSQIQSRAKLYLIASTLKIGLMFGFAFAFIPRLSSPVTVFEELRTGYAGLIYDINVARSFYILIMFKL